MRFAAGEGKHMFNKRLTAAQVSGNPDRGQKKSRG
jgi:hypothetical protein